ncbi:MAG: ribosome biogenesis GTPase Der, partial [Candidatus Marinimicrobia bacterium]|nr:ribosome biogenesis GTPase Der [Candidatus Neomarinimicrobiota bacterium]
MAKPTVAIIGRPNVGKSTLFNRLVGRRQAIVEETAGVTRDRIYGQVQWRGYSFHLIDTGGYIPAGGDVISETVRRQADLAGEEADLILLMVDSQTGPAADDLELADRLRKLDKPVLLLVNKVDDQSHEKRALDFYELGMGTPLVVGAIGGRAVGDLLDAVMERLEGSWTASEEEQDSLGLAIVGVPNAGKSSFLNAITKQEKSIVTDIPGTTRDSVDSYLNYLGHKIRLIDTAGLRRKARIKDAIEFYSTVRAYRAIDECRVAIVMLDAQRGFHDQDRQIMSYVLDQGKGMVVAINKWDTVAKVTGTMGQWVKELQAAFNPLAHYPLVFTSVTRNQRLWKVMKTAIEVSREADRKIPTAELNDFLAGALGYLSPPAV